MMKPSTVLLVILSLFSTALWSMVEPGDSVDKMRLELGEPTAQIRRGEVTAYSYPRGVVHVKDGRVIKLSSSFYDRVEKISRQTSEGTIEKTVSEGIFEDSPVSEPPTESEATVDHRPFVWLSDYSEAKAMSEELQLPMLVLFTQSDDCGACRELDELILSDVVFKQYAQDRMVLLRLNFSKNNELPEAVMAEQMELKNQFAVELFPMMVFVDPAGVELNRLGYKYLPPEAFVMMVDEILLDGGKSAEEIGNEVLHDEFGDTIDSLLMLDSLGGSHLLLSAQIFVGSILTFMLIRRLMRRR